MMLTALIFTHVVGTTTTIQDDPYAQYKVDFIAVGQKVPNFKVVDSEGSSFELYEALKGSKVTLINFWFDT